MLGKVMKYELRAAGRLLLPFFCLAVLFCAVMRGLMWAAPRVWAPAAGIVGALSSSLSVLLMVAIVVLAFAYMVVRFYQSMAANEAYLSFTLPVKPSTHLVGRLLVGTLYTLLSFVVVAVCVLIFVPGLWDAVLHAGISGGTGSRLSVSLWDLPLNIKLSALGLVLVTAIVAAATNLLQFYASIAVGTQIARNRILGSIAAWLILNTAQSILTVPLLLIPGVVIGNNSEALQQYVSGLVTGQVNSTLANLLGFMWMAMGFVLLISLLFAVVHFVLCNYLFAKRLNLE